MIEAESSARLARKAGVEVKGTDADDSGGVISVGEAVASSGHREHDKTPGGRASSGGGCATLSVVYCDRKRHATLADQSGQSCPNLPVHDTTRTPPEQLACSWQRSSGAALTEAFTSSPRCIPCSHGSEETLVALPPAAKSRSHAHCAEGERSQSPAAEMRSRVASELVYSQPPDDAGDPSGGMT